MNDAEIPWSKGVLLICQKCGKSFSESFSSEELRSNLKSSFKANGISPAIRVVASSCLDVCIPEEQAVAYCPVNGPTQVATFMGKDLEKQIEEFARRQIE